MPSLTIRDVPTETRDILAARAAKSGRSLQEYLKAKLVELAERPDLEDVIGRIREQKRLMGGRVSREAILRHRDADRA